MSPGVPTPATSTPLAVVSDPTAKMREVVRITRPKRVTSRRTAKAFNPLSHDDCELFAAFMNGQHRLRGFKNGDIRRQLAGTTHLRGIGPDETCRKAMNSRTKGLPAAPSLNLLAAWPLGEQKAVPGTPQGGAREPQLRRSGCPRLPERGSQPGPGPRRAVI
jgi:hypothetical protein